MKNKVDLKRMRSKHKTAKAKIQPNTANDITAMKDPFEAVRTVASHDLVTACAIIDSLNGLMAAIILFGMKMSLPHTKDRTQRRRMRNILARAALLQIRGAKGLLYERNKLFQKTGVLLV